MVIRLGDEPCAGLSIPTSPARDLLSTKCAPENRPPTGQLPALRFVIVAATL